MKVAKPYSVVVSDTSIPALTRSLMASTDGSPQRWPKLFSGTWLAPTNPATCSASGRGTPRFVMSASEYSAVRFTKPFSVRGSPRLPLTVKRSPSES